MNKRTFFLLITFSIAVNFTGLMNNVFTGDSALYAVISKSFCTSNNFLDIYVNGRDWLDKPHFPFWVCALSMKIFGINTFGYKFPSLVFFVISLIYTYKIAKRLYNIQTAYLSVLILSSSLHIFISNNDTRAESILLGLITGGVYHMLKLSENFTVRNVFISSLYCAAAVMTKGIFVLIIFYSAIFGDMLLKKEFIRILNYRWLAVFLLTLLFILPEIYALYRQFDLHPEKAVFDKTNVSGVKFFIWDSQFGRFFNTGPITGRGDILFFIHVLLWAFAPWAIIGFLSIGRKFSDLLKRDTSKEYITFFGFIIMFAVFSLSGFQLPHYTNIIFPFISILCAYFIIEKINHKICLPIYYISLLTYMVAQMAILILLEYYFVPDKNIIAASFIIFCGMLLMLPVYFSGMNKIYSVFSYSLIFSMIFYLYQNLGFYPKLLKYQSGSEAAFFINKKFPDHEIVSSVNDYPLQFYIKNKFSIVDAPDALQIFTNGKKIMLFADLSFLKKLEEMNIEYSVVKTFEHFHITMLTKEFINYKTRPESIELRYLVEI